MRLHYLRLRGITEAFPNEVCVDFDSLVRAGIRNARAKGKKLGGRPRVAVDASRIAALRSQGHSWGTIRRETGIAKGTAQRAFYSLHPIRAS